MRLARFIVNCGCRVTVPNEERMRAAGLPPPVLGVHRIASQGLVAKIVAPALPSTSRSAEATCGVVGDQGAPAGASACINSQARTVPLGARVTATWNGFCFVRGRWLEREHGARLHGGALDLAEVRHPQLGE